MKKPKISKQAKEGNSKINMQGAPKKSAMKVAKVLPAHVKKPKISGQK